jgi:periplasmic divalent cation tolerance protein
MLHLLVYITFPDRETARTVLRTLMRERLAACAQFFDIDSVYWWKDELEEGPEIGVLLKTTDESYTALETRIRELHPYEVPEIIAIPIDRGSRDYLDWVRKETRT